MSKNTVVLLGHYGSDEVISCSAWTSTSRELTDEKRSRIPKLINMLWSEGHETPFEKATIHFLVDCDIASHIHLLKHRIASINAESARYKELKEDKMYIPEDWYKPYQNDDDYKGIANTGIGHTKSLADALKVYSELGNRLYHESLEQLSKYGNRKRAKESARFFKGYNSQIQSDISFNMRSFANFIKLRNSEHAQLEIREIAQQMWDLVEGIEGQPFKYSLEAISNRINK